MSLKRRVLHIYIFLKLIFFANISFADSLDNWKMALWEDAKAANISEAVFKDALSDFKPIERVVSLDRKQPEFTLTFDTYLERIISEYRVKKARNKLIEHKQILSEISTKYNVQPRFIITLWAIETNFGENTGGFNVPHALATLAFDGRRSEYFRKELINALKIIENGHITASNMNGSWAGAMGQSQFMPSSYLSYSEDWDKDGKADIWTNKSDVFASIANYLSSVGWSGNQTWGREVIAPHNLQLENLLKNKTAKNVNQWQQLGLRNANSTDLPVSEISAYLVRPATSNRLFLVYGNYNATLKWNRSHYFALAVGILSDRLR